MTEQEKTKAIEEISQVTGLEFRPYDEVWGNGNNGKKIVFATAEGRADGFGGHLRDPNYPSLRIYHEAMDFSGYGFFYLYYIVPETVAA